MASGAAPSLLTIPSELRNVIYLYIFNPETELPAYEVASFDTIAAALKLQFDDRKPTSDQCLTHQLRVLQTCRQIHHEANVLALSLTGFHVAGEYADPDCFASRIAHIRTTKLEAIRHLTLTARISHLRALNESWAIYPFGNSVLNLDTLTIIPKKPDAVYSAYAEVADLSQSHTMAYIFAETFKRLRNVRLIYVKNRGCFNEVVWRLVYRSLVYRTWRWGGGKCGLRFECCSDDERNGEEWFKVWLKDTDEGHECGDSTLR